MRPSVRASILAVALAALVLLGANFGMNSNRAVAAPGSVNTVGIDMRIATFDGSAPTGNNATQAGPVENCNQLSVAGTLTIDVVVDAIDPADPSISFQFALNYNPAVVQVTGVNNGMLIMSNAFSGPSIDFSDSVPDSDGQFVAALVDFSANPLARETGEGVLSRITLTGVAAGSSALTLTAVKVEKTGPVNLVTAGTQILNATAKIGARCPLVVNSTGDAGDAVFGDGFCDTALNNSICTLRAAITESNFPFADTISFNIPSGGPQTIAVGAALPYITDQVTINGTTQPGCGSYPCVTLNGAGAGAGAFGLLVSGANSTVTGLTITAFSWPGIGLVSSGNTVTRNVISAGASVAIYVDGSNNTIGGTSGLTWFGPCTGVCNAMTGNLAGVFVVAGTGNVIRGNSISGHASLGIDLSPSGVTANDIPPIPALPDTDTGANDLQNFPRILSVLNSGGQMLITGTLNSTPGVPLMVDGYFSSTCNPSAYGEGTSYLGSVPVTPGANGLVSGSFLVPAVVPVEYWITATATGPSGTSEFSQCSQVLSDSDGDGVHNAIDVAPGPGDFSDVGGGGDTYGHIASTGGLRISIVDLPNPQGVVVGAVGSGGPAVIDACGTASLRLLGPGAVTTIDCGSITAGVLLGPVELTFGTITATLPSDTTATVADSGGGDFQVTSSPSSSSPIVVGGMSMDPGGSTTVADTDGDGQVGQVDLCPTVATPWVVEDGDTDCDAWTSAHEEVIGTDPGDNCGLAKWPPDFDDSQQVDISDVNLLAPPVFFTTSGPWFPRRDIVPDGTIDISDVNRLAPPMFFATCTP